MPKKPPENGSRPKPGPNFMKNKPPEAGKNKQPEKAVRFVPEVVIEQKGKSQRATVEEVDDSGDEDDSPRDKGKGKEMPFRHVKPVEHSVPGPVLPCKLTDKLIAEEISKLQSKAYIVKSALDDLSATQETLRQIMETEIPVKIKHLLGSSPALQRDLKAKTSKTRRTNFVLETEGDLLANKIELESSRTNSDDSRKDPLPFANEPKLLDGVGDAFLIDNLPFDTYASIITHQVDGLPEGAVVLGDPVLQYLDSLAPGEVPKELYAIERTMQSSASAALRVIFPIINGVAPVESILDSGSQIVSMSGTQAAELQIPYNPDIQILMQSANGQVERTLGLARNIPYKCSHITVYLQIHVVRNAPYKSLLGRPFEVLTESSIKSSRDGSQTITMTDPFSGNRVTIPTHERGRVREAKRPTFANEVPPKSEGGSDTGPDF